MRNPKTSKPINNSGRRKCYKEIKQPDGTLDDNTHEGRNCYLSCLLLYSQHLGQHLKYGR